MSDLGPGRRAQERYGGPRNSAGQQLYPGGLPVGSEPFWVNWLTPLPALGDDSILGAFAENFLRYLAFEPDAGPLYSSAQFDFDKDLPRMASAAKLFTRRRSTLPRRRISLRPISRRSLNMAAS